jgi:GNAT superfamily N-acetyltransferase
MTFAIVRGIEADIAALIPLIQAQQERQQHQDARLPLTSADDIATILRNQCTHDGHSGTPLVARNAQGQVRGYAQAATWHLKETSLLRSFLTADNGIVRTLTVPPPHDADTQTVMMALLDTLDSYWNDVATTGDLIRWPSTDAAWIEPLLIARGFRLDSMCALRPLQPSFFPVRPESLLAIQIRTARPDDEEALVALFEEELRFHERMTPFVHSSPQVLHAFRNKLARIWEGEAFEQGTPIVLVVEHEGAIVAMAENTMLEVGPQDDPGFTPPGRYWCFDNVSVREHFHGQGLGRLLVQAVEDIRWSLHLELDGSVLWFNPDNPNAARFWSRLGFQPLWTTYQRMRGRGNGTRS